MQMNVSQTTIHNCIAMKEEYERRKNLKKISKRSTYINGFFAPNVRACRIKSNHVFFL